MKYHVLMFPNLLFGFNLSWPRGQCHVAGSEIKVQCKVTHFSYQLFIFHLRNNSVIVCTETFLGIRLDSCWSEPLGGSRNDTESDLCLNLCVHVWYRRWREAPHLPTVTRLLWEWTETGCLAGPVMDLELNDLLSESNKWKKHFANLNVLYILEATAL